MTPNKGQNRVTSPYGYRIHPITREYKFHYGIDSVAQDRNVRAIWDCVKTETAPGYNYGRGNLVRLYYSATLRVIFQHLASIEIKAGQVVKQGNVVGVMGNTGDSTGVHLHSEVQVLRGGKWVAVNPAQYINLPNRVGTYSGNDNLDKPEQTAETPASVVMSTLTIGPMTSGDRLLLTQQAEALGLPVRIEESLA